MTLTQNFEACDFILSNDTKLKVSQAFDCTVQSKPAEIPLTVASSINNLLTLVDSPSNAGVVIPFNQEFAFGVNATLTAQNATLTASGTPTATNIPLVDTPANIGITIPDGTALVFNGNNNVTTYGAVTLTGTGDTLTVVSCGDSVVATNTAPLTPTPTSIPLADTPANAGITIPSGVELIFNGNNVITNGVVTLTGTGDTLTVISGGDSVVATNTTSYSDEVLVISAEEKALTGINDAITLAEIPITTTTIDNYTYNFDQLAEVYSINQADSSFEGNEIEDCNFKSGTWASKRVTSRMASISCSGVLVKNDPGLDHAVPRFARSHS